MCLRACVCAKPAGALGKLVFWCPLPNLAQGSFQPGLGYHIPFSPLTTSHGPVGQRACHAPHIAFQLHDPEMGKSAWSLSYTETQLKGKEHGDVGGHRTSCGAPTAVVPGGSGIGSVRQVRQGLLALICHGCQCQQQPHGDHLTASRGWSQAG